MVAHHAEDLIKRREFFRLWLDEGMHYTSASYLTGDETLEEAQINKARILYDYAEMNENKRVLDIGCGDGALLAHLGAVPSEVVRAACATVSADATASIALLDALKARGAVDDAAALLLETTAAALTDAAHATAPGAATASVIFTVSAASSGAAK